MNLALDNIGVLVHRACHDKFSLENYWKPMEVTF